jgi:hypothetical protein
MALWNMVRQQPRWPHRPLWLLSGRRRLVTLVVIKKEPNQLYGAVGTAAELGTTRARAKKISSESDASTAYIGSLFDSDEIEEL